MTSMQIAEGILHMVIADKINPQKVSARGSLKPEFLPSYLLLLYLTSRPGQSNCPSLFNFEYIS